MSKKYFSLMLVFCAAFLVVAIGTVSLLWAIGVFENDGDNAQQEPGGSDFNNSDEDEMPDGVGSSGDEKNDDIKTDEDTDENINAERPERLPDSSDDGDTDETDEGEDHVGNGDDETVIPTDPDESDNPDEEPPSESDKQEESDESNESADTENNETEEEKGDTGGTDIEQAPDKTPGEPPVIGIISVGINKNGELFVMFTDNRSQIYEDSSIRMGMAIQSATVSAEGLVTVVFSNGESISFQKKK